MIFKVRKLTPCYLTGLRFDVEIPEEDELQITLYGMILGQGVGLSICHKLSAIASNNPTSDLSSISHQNKKNKQGNLTE